MKRFSAFCLMLCIGVIPAMPLGANEVVLENRQGNDQKKSDKDAKREASIKAKAELFGLGADVKVVMRRTNLQGEHVTHRGIISEISAEGFGLQVKDETLQIRYGQIDRLNLSKNKYKADGPVDPARVRQVAAELGTGKKIQLKLTSDKKMTGEILSFKSDSLVIAETNVGQIETVPYHDVKEIKGKGWPVWSKVLIIGGVAFTALAIASAIYLSSI